MVWAARSLWGICVWISGMTFVLGLAIFFLAGATGSWQGLVLAAFVWAITAAFFVAAKCIRQGLSFRPNNVITMAPRRVEGPSKKRTMLLIIAVSFLLFGLTTSIIRNSGLHFNSSSSVPIGLYREAPEPATLGSVAGYRYAGYWGFCLPSPAVRMVAAADISLEHGTCPGGVAPVLKTLYRADHSRPLVYRPEGFYVNGALVRNTAPRPRTHSGKAMPHYPFGTYTSGLWAISDFNPNSYDSRYFGPIQEGNLKFFARPVLTSNKQ